MEHLRFHHTTEYSWREEILSAVSLLVALEFLYFSFWQIMGSLFEEWTLSEETRIWQVHVGFVIIIVCHVLTRLLGKYARLVNAGLCFGALLGLGVYGYRHWEDIWQGLIYKCNPYLVAWNRYYKTNYSRMLGDRELEEYAFAAVIVILWLVVLLLFYLTNLQIMLFVPGILALAAGLLVNHVPNWIGLRGFFMGIFLVLVGNSRTRRVTFVSSQKNRMGAEVLFFRSLLSFLALWILGMLLVTGSGTVFTPLAEKIPERARAFMDFQVKMEQDIKNVRIPSVVAFTSKAYVDNSTPQYTGKEILRISAGTKPSSNLYLCEFVSGTYENGHWNEDYREFENAVQEDGLEVQAVRESIAQMPFENAVVQNRQPVSEWEFLIKYKRRGDNRALVPYFTNISGNDGIWAEKEGLIKKKRGENSLWFRGASSNVNLSFSYYYDTRHAIENQWYSGYVNKHYRKTSDLGSIHRLVAQLNATLASSLTTPNVIMLDTAEYLYDYYPVNYNRWLDAAYIRNALQEKAEYNLYLDQLPAGMDVIDYFLEEGHEGYCMHFATAGTLALQECGVPARYASGYVVKRDAFVPTEDSGYQAIVTDRNAHSWVEIYIENIGWVPFEMTPGYHDERNQLMTDESMQQSLQIQHEAKSDSEVSEEPSESESEENSEEDSEEDSSQISDTETEAETEVEAEKQPEEEGGFSFGFGSAQGNGASSGKLGVIFAKIWGILKVVGKLLVILLVVGFAFRYCWKKYQTLLLEELQKKQYRRAVKRINRRLYYRLRRSGKVFKRVTDVEYETALTKAYPAISQEDWKEFMRIAKKVAYSKEAVSQEEMAFCYHIYKHHKKL